MNETNAKKYTLNFITALLLFCGAGTAASYILDPFQIFHDPFFTNDKYVFHQERFKNAGFINRLLPREDCCDTLVMGSSYSQNFLPSDVTKSFNSRGVLQIPLPGSLPTEQALVYEKAAASGEIRTVIWDVAGIYGAQEIIPVNSPLILNTDPWKYFPAYLYDANSFNDYRILPSASIFKNFIDLLLRGESYELSQSWFDEAKNSFNNGSFLRKLRPDVGHKSVAEDQNNYDFPAVDKILIPTIQKHPEQEFYIFIPPYSRHFYATMTQDIFERDMALRHTLAQRLSELPNARFFAFDNLLETTNDLDNYRDYQHYDEATSKRILELMAADKGRLTAKNIEQDIRSLTRAVNRYSEELTEKQGQPGL